MKKKQFMRSHANKLAVVLLVAIILGTPVLLRGFDNLDGADPYFNQRLVELMEEDRFPGTDPLSFSSRPFFYPVGTPLLLYYIEKIVPSNIALNLLPFLLGILTVVLMFPILKKFGFNDKLALIASTVLVFSPPFIYNFSIFNMVTIPVFLNILAIYLFLLNKRISNIFSVLIFLIIPFFGYLHVIFSMIFLFAYGLKKRNVNFLIILILLLTGVAYYNQISSGLAVYSVEEKDILLRAVSEFGGNLGISLFSLLIIFFGLRHLWKDKYKNRVVYIILLVLFLLFLFEQRLGIYLMIFMSPIISLGILEINKSLWRSGLIKYLTIIILISGLVFSGLSFLSKIPQFPPNEEMINSLEFIKDRTNQGDVVFSHQENGVFINSLGKRPNVIDVNSAFAPEIRERLGDSKTLFYSRDFETVKEIIDKYNIKYIYITPDMKNGLVWNEPEEGLLFVLEFSGNNFKRIYNNNGIEVWRVNF